MPVRDAPRPHIRTALELLRAGLRAAPTGWAGSTESNAAVTASATLRAPARVTPTDRQNLRRARARQLDILVEAASPPIARVRKCFRGFGQCGLASAPAILQVGARPLAERWCGAAASGGGTMVHSATAAPAVSVVIARLGVQYSPLGPSALIATRPRCPAGRSRDCSWS